MWQFRRHSAKTLRFDIWENSRNRKITSTTLYPSTLKQVIEPLFNRYLPYNQRKGVSLKTGTQRESEQTSLAKFNPSLPLDQTLLSNQTSSWLYTSSSNLNINRYSFSYEGSHLIWNKQIRMFSPYLCLVTGSWVMNPVMTKEKKYFLLYMLNSNMWLPYWTMLQNVLLATTAVYKGLPGLWASCPVNLFIYMSTFFSII